MDKKGYVFVPFIVIGTFFVLTFALLVLSKKYEVRDSEGNQRFVGEKQSQIFLAYQKGENALFYISQSARYSAQSTITKLAANESGCDTIFGYGVWVTKTANCIPNKISAENKFKEEFKDRLASFTSKYSDAAIPTFDNYDISSQNDKLKIIGDSSSDLIISTSKLYSNVLVTHYYAPSEKDFSTWYTAEDYTKYPGNEIESWCAIPMEKRGFFEEVKCEGAGVGISGTIYNYKTIKPTKESSTTTDKISTATGTVATPHRTIAVAPDMIPYGSKVDVEFEGCTQNSCCSQWNGEYIAEDTGVAMQNDWKLGKPHIDLFVGTGLDQLKQSECLPGGEVNKAALIVKQKGGLSTGDIIYRLKPAFKSEINYSFDEYDKLGADILSISEETTHRSECNKKESKDECIKEILNRYNDFKWSLKCDISDLDADKYPQYLFLCAESRYGIPTDSGIKHYIYKIAYFAGDDVAPAQVTGITTSDTQLAEKKVTISFNANTEPDVAYYDIYHSENPFTDVSNSEKYDLMINQDPSKTSYDQILDVPQDGKQYYFAVTAVDTTGNENTQVVSVQGTSTDDLKPGPINGVTVNRLSQTNPFLDVYVNHPTTNEDGSKVTDVTKYTIYFSDSDVCDQYHISSILNDYIDKQDYSFEKTTNQGSDVDKIVQPQPQLPKFANSKTYCMVVIAGDDGPDKEPTSNQYGANSFKEIKT